MDDHGAHIIYVHGLWQNGLESWFLKRRLERACHMPMHAFSYGSVTAHMNETTARLRAFIQKLSPKTLHLIGHSLGGLVIYRFLEQYPDQPPGRVVFLGTPSMGSRAALGIARLKWAAPLIGRRIGVELTGTHSRQWPAGRELGVIAGTRSRGLGQFVARFDDEASDGTVCVSETRIPGATGHVTLPVSHTGLLLSASVAEQAAAFLQTGHFSVRA